MGKPVLYYSLAAFEKSPIEEIVLVTGAGEEAYCREEIVQKFGISKVKAIVSGGKERWQSSYQGICAASGDYVLVHDGARPFITADVISRMMENALLHKAAIAAVPSKDTIKVADENGFVQETPERSHLWAIQTPQAFSRELLLSSYQKLISMDNPPVITDDAMVVEYATDEKVRLVMGDYTNIKLTTPEDLPIGEAILRLQSLQAP